LVVFLAKSLEKTEKSDDMEIPFGSAIEIDQSAVVI
jgi:hypothetical protein